uniref:Protein kinase domain-containing protein n=1 Tax=Kalanchoe fedtschenkoi TaxID=63787 RepID=A0A7N0UVH0_KALFE
MGGICSKGSGAIADSFDASQAVKEQNNNSSVILVAPCKGENVVIDVSSHGSSVRPLTNPPAIQAASGDNGKTIIVERPASGHRTMDLGSSGRQPTIARTVSLAYGSGQQQVVAGWPSWLSSVAGEAIQGWVPRRTESFERFEKIGQGTYSSVYKARDLETGKIVAMKKVRFVNMDPESVRFMAREIHILRQLDHPNVMKLECIVTSRMSGSLYLVFEYMEHDLTGLLATHGVKFTESQIKCYMHQLFRGLEHCHSRGILHRDIKGSNLLVDNNGVLKIGDFGLANFFNPHQPHPLTSRVVTLWYRAPELLLGATEYGVAIDLWSAGCILAELLAGKPIMPGRTEVEQMHKIFKLCGSPSEEYWKKPKLPHATSFKPNQPYKRRLTDTFKDFPPSALALIDVLLSMEPEGRGTASSALNSEFFTTKPLPCAPSSLPKYTPSKEFDVKLRDEEKRRQKAEAVKGRGPESVRRGPRETKAVPSPEFDNQGRQGQSISHKYKHPQDIGSGFRLEAPRGIAQKGYMHSTSMIHPSVYGSSRHTRTNEGETVQPFVLPKAQRSHTSRETDLSNRKDESVSGRDATTGYIPKKNRIHYSGPLMPPGGNLDDMLKEHERQIQQAVRKARLDKNRTGKNF